MSFVNQDGVTMANTIPKYLLYATESRNSLPQICASLHLAPSSSSSHFLPSFLSLSLPSLSSFLLLHHPVWSQCSLAIPRGEDSDCLTALVRKNQDRVAWEHWVCCLPCASCLPRTEIQTRLDMPQAWFLFSHGGGGDWSEQLCLRRLCVESNVVSYLTPSLMFLLLNQLFPVNREV